jgi:AcrR family transcriptional regulator
MAARGVPADDVPADGGGWLDGARHDLAREQLLDAAAVLFAEHGVASVRMAEVARAAGCSRATLYRYYANRDELRAAFVDREARRIGADIAESVAGIDDPHDQLVTAVVAALRAVRRDATLMAWFTSDNAGTALDVAHASTVIARLAATFVGDAPDADRAARADWLVRSIVSLLVTPGPTPAAERTMIERFVAPVLVASIGGRRR